MCHGNPLILNEIASILRQTNADDRKLLETIEEEIVTEPSETVLPVLPKATRVNQEREIFDSEKEGIDKDQENCLRNFLSA